MKNTMKLFALCATVLAFSAALASCQKEKATPEVPEMHVFHVELNATVADTKATYTTASKEITFESGDALYIVLAEPTSAAWSGAAGTLTYDGTSFKGDIAYTGTYEGSDIITDAKDLTATFLPKGYDSVNYLSATGEATATNAFYAGAKDASVPQLVHLTATVSDKAGVAKTPLTLSAQNSVLCYSINANKLSAGAHTVSVSDGTTTISGSVTAVADAATTFAVAFPANATEQTYTLSIAGYNDVAKGGKTLVSGKVVNIATDVEDATISGVFSVGPATTVKFSLGNLQYNSNTQKWQFAEHQYTYVGNAAGNTSVTETGIANNSGIVDLFGWVGASSTWTGLAQYGISSSTETNSKDGYGDDDTESLKSDWGTLIGTGWRTLTSEEWFYLFGMEANNTDKSGHARYRKYFRATVNDVTGIVVLPDDISGISDIPAESSRGTASTFNGKTYTTSAWSTLETTGAVFLPAAGSRYVTYVYSVGTYGVYWSSTPYSSGVNYAYRLLFSSGSVRPADYSNRSSGLSVRLVQDQ